jgi:hypothetical protein
MEAECPPAEASRISMSPFHFSSREVDIHQLDVQLFENMSVSSSRKSISLITPLLQLAP